MKEVAIQQVGLGLPEGAKLFILERTLESKVQVGWSEGAPAPPNIERTARGQGIVAPPL
jgi:hypothetical protein